MAFHPRHVEPPLLFVPNYNSQNKIWRYFGKRLLAKLKRPPPPPFHKKKTPARNNKKKKKTKKKKRRSNSKQCDRSSYDMHCTRMCRNQYLPSNPCASGEQMYSCSPPWHVQCTTYPFDVCYVVELTVVLGIHSYAYFLALENLHLLFGRDELIKVHDISTLLINRIIFLFRSFRLYAKTNKKNTNRHETTKKSPHRFFWGGDVRHINLHTLFLIYFFLDT